MKFLLLLFVVSVAGLSELTNEPLTPVEIAEFSVKWIERGGTPDSMLATETPFVIRHQLSTMRLMDYMIEVFPRGTNDAFNRAYKAMDEYNAKVKEQGKSTEGRFVVQTEMSKSRDR